MEHNNIFFIGIGGIGMSALAQLYTAKGKNVTGSDRGTSGVTELLEKKGVVVHIGHIAELITDDIDMVVYTDAIAHDNPALMRAKELGIKTLSYFEALGEATQNGTSIVISGTHGKTTTTAMIAKILIDLGKEPTVIAGSILSEYGSNFVTGRNDLYVIEGCEYKRHFLHLHPDLLVINNIELDHTDYFKDLHDMQVAFREVVDLLPRSGTVVTDTTQKTITPVLIDVEQTVVEYQKTSVPTMKVKGEFNEKNAQAAKTAVMSFFDDVTEREVDSSLKGFKGTWRRFEYKGITKQGAVVYDDYAHHPTAVLGTIEMVKKEFSDKKLTVVFHPHLYSRTKEFFNEFVQALSKANEVLVLPIYAAREAFDPTVTSQKLVEKIHSVGGSAKFVQDFATAKRLLNEKKEDDIILTMGAGDVYLLGDEIVNR